MEFNRALESDFFSLCLVVSIVVHRRLGIVGSISSVCASKEDGRIDERAQNLLDATVPAS
jgi:hypothetical protein